MLIGAGSAMVGVLAASAAPDVKSDVSSKAPYVTTVYKDSRAGVYMSPSKSSPKIGETTIKAGQWYRFTISGGVVYYYVGNGWAAIYPYT